MSDERRWRDAACHCRTVKFRVRLTDDLATARRCTCSYCRMRGAVVVSAPLSDIDFVEGEDNLTLYRFNTGAAEHWFCKTCGIYTHHRRRSNPNQFGVNAACLDGVSPFDFRAVEVMDGISHPSDVGGEPRVAGILRFEPTT
ncbi:MAG: GFA family protein [Hyphomicrobiales bacterium]|nr:GFA family protein [Hyphomicrobiales bacterium]